MPIQALRDVSLIILSILSFIMCLIPLAVMFLAVRGTLALQRKTEALAPQAQAQVRKVQALVEQGSQKVVTPVVRLNRTYAKWTAAGRFMAQSLRRPDQRN